MPAESSSSKVDEASLGAWLLLAECSVLVVDTSAYVVAAASYSANPVLIYAMEAGRGGQRPVSCTPDRPATLEEIMDPKRGFTV